MSNYLGYVPLVTTADFWYNPNSQIRDGAQKGYDTSLYHLDWADNRILKLFVHCTDITDTNGPLILVDPDSSAKVRDAIDYRYALHRNTLQSEAATDGLYINDEMLTRHAGSSPRKTVMTGATGSVYIADTARCFHYGGRNTEIGAPRLLGVLLYLRPRALKLTAEHGDVPPFRHLAHDGLSQVQRLVLGATNS